MAHRSSSEFAIVKLGLCPAADALQSCSLLPSPHPLAPLPRHPRTTRTAQRRRLAGERRAAEGGAVQARRIYRSCPVGGGAHLQLDPAQPAGSPDPATDAAAQRHRSLEHDAQNGLATLSTTGALMAKKTDPFRDRHDAIRKTLGLVLALSIGLHGDGLGCTSGTMGAMTP